MISSINTHLEILVSELSSVNALAPGAVMVCEVPALAHELRDHAVEGGALEPEPGLARAQLTEVLRRARHHVAPKLEGNPTQTLKNKVNH